MTETVVVAILERCARSPAGHIENSANGLIAAPIEEGWLRRRKGGRGHNQAEREVVAVLRQGAVRRKGGPQSITRIGDSGALTDPRRTRSRT